MSEWMNDPVRFWIDDQWFNLRKKINQLFHEKKRISQDAIKCVKSMLTTLFKTKKKKFY